MKYGIREDERKEGSCIEGDDWGLGFVAQIGYEFGLNWCLWTEDIVDFGILHKIKTCIQKVAVINCK